MDSFDDEETAMWDFDGESLSEVTGDSNAPPSETIIEMEFALKAKHIDRDFTKALISPKQLSAFMAYAITSLNPEQAAASKECNFQIARVLANQVDPSIVIHDPGEDFDPATSLAVYSEDMGMLVQSDVLIINHCFPAEGVGMLAATASARGMPILSVKPSTVSLTPMYEGLPGRTHVIVSFDNSSDLSSLLPSAIAKIIPEARAYSQQRESFRNDDLVRGLRRQRLISEISLEQLSYESNLKASALFQIEKNPDLLLNLPQPTIWNIGRVLHADVTTKDGILKFDFAEQLPDSAPMFVRTSLENLVSCVESRSAYSLSDDEAIINAWQAYNEETLMASRYREEKAKKPVGCAEWERRIAYFKRYGGTTL